MRRFDRIGDFLAEFREQLREHVIPGQPLAILGFKKFLANHAFRVDEKIARPRHPCIRSDRLRVQNLVHPDHF